ncbi:MAG: Peptidase, M23/M37 family [Clostridia bacterium 41_269]|nr:MAG: Peptidase, M23/M37 family [Clostridia bacterium 41_269]
MYFFNAYNNMVQETKRLETVSKVSKIQEKKINELEKKAEDVEEKIVEINRLKEQVSRAAGLKSRESTAEKTSGTSSKSRKSSAENISKGGSGGGMPAPGFLGGFVLCFNKKEPSGFERLENLEREMAFLELQLTREKRALEKLLDDVNERMAYTRALPNLWPVQGRIASTFGWRSSPFGGGEEFHDGLDIAAPYGTPIKAAGEGRVVQADWEPGYGKIVVINHDYGYISCYAHCSKILVKSGQKVEKGEIIAKIGSTGRSTGPHLHLSIRYGGRLIDPLEILD